MKYIISRRCDLCGVTYTRRRDRIGAFCSPQCRNMVRANGEYRRCLSCGSEFWAAQQQRKKFCSSQCWNDSRTLSAIDRFLAKVDLSGECWIWQANRNDDGYGLFESRSAHAWIHHYVYGPLPPGYERDHLCRIRLCVNPTHLEVVTHQENVARGRVAEANRSRVRKAVPT